MIDNIGAIPTLQQRIELCTQLRCRFETSAWIKIVFEEAIDRTRYMSTDRIQYFIFTAKAIRRTGIDNQMGILLKKLEQRVTINRRLIDTIGKFARNRLFNLIAKRLPCVEPGCQATIQYGHPTMPQPTQQPPEPGGKHASGIIIGNHLRIVADAATPQHCCQIFRLW